MLTVKEVSKKFNISEYTLRYYTDENLIPSIKRDKNNIRIFDEESLNWLKTIICLRKCGMSIKSIKEYVDLCIIGDSTILQRLDIINSQKVIIDKKIQELKESSLFLEKKKDLYDDIIKNNKKDITNPNNW